MFHRLPVEGKQDAAALMDRRAHLEIGIGWLHDESVERALHPAVIARKISCGNKTDRGRQTWKILSQSRRNMRVTRKEHERLLHRRYSAAQKKQDKQVLKRGSNIAGGCVSRSCALQ